MTGPKTLIFGYRFPFITITGLIFTFSTAVLVRTKSIRIPILEHLNHMLFHLHPFADPYRGTSVNVF